MRPISDFAKGMGMRPVDWSTRHNSRAYEAGMWTTTIGVMAAPLIVLFVVGFITGRLNG